MADAPSRGANGSMPHRRSPAAVDDTRAVTAATLARTRSSAASRRGSSGALRWSSAKLLSSLRRFIASASNTRRVVVLKVWHTRE